MVGFLGQFHIRTLKALANSYYAIYGVPKTKMYLTSVVEQVLIGQQLKRGGINAPASYVGIPPRYKPTHANLHFSYIDVTYNSNHASNSIESIFANAGDLKFEELINDADDKFCVVRITHRKMIFELFKIHFLLGLPLLNLYLVFNQASLKRNANAHVVSTISF